MKLLRLFILIESNIFSVIQIVNLYIYIVATCTINK